MALLKKTIRPEFLNRIDDVVIFHPLGRQHIRRIVDIQLSHVLEMLNRQKVRLTVTDAVKDWLAERGYDPVYGARPLKRIIQTQLVNPLSKYLLRREDALESIQLEATVGKNGSGVEFTEVYDDVEAWAEE
jgi:ATP-dependent Clp protease ATP-binding subunit ClpB